MNQMVRVGTREIEVDSSPLPTGAQSPDCVGLDRLSPTQLVFRTVRASRILGTGCLLVSLGPFFLALLCVAAYAIKPNGDSLFGLILFLALGVVFLLFGCLITGPKLFFDRERNRLYRNFFFRRQVRQLTDVIAVQAIYGGMFHGRRNSRFSVYQLNLVFDHTDTPRMLLLFERDADSLKQKAEQLARFLEVPLLSSC